MHFKDRQTMMIEITRIGSQEMVSGGTLACGTRFSASSLGCIIIWFTIALLRHITSDINIFFIIIDGCVHGGKRVYYLGQPLFIFIGRRTLALLNSVAIQ